MGKIIAIVCSIAIAFGFQTPPPSLSTTPQGYTYRLIDLYPRYFPLLPQIPWPPIHPIYQDALHVHGSPGAPPPDLVKFLFVMNSGGYYLMPVTHVTYLGPEDWLLQTPAALIPHLLPGFVSIKVINSNTNISSNRKAGIIG